MVSRSLVSTIFALTLTTSIAAAQSDDLATAPTPRLTVRPHEAATGTKTPKAGLIELQGFPEYYLYVPAKCVGTKRSPFMVLLHGGGRSASMEIEKFSTLADKYGIIVLLPNASDPGKWEMVYGGMQSASPTETGMRVSEIPMHDVHNIDSAMKLVLHTNAIDPNRIALLGFSDGGSSSLMLGRSNLDVFNRIAALSALISFDGVGPENPKAQFFLSGGIAENMVQRTIKMGQILRHQGHPVATLLGLRPHVDKVEDEDFVWDWLVKSWADPSITARVVTPKDSDPPLTVDALKKMTDFWTRFRQEPDSVISTGRMQHQERIPLMLGQEPTAVIIMNIKAMATTYPSVASDLQAAGLTAQQEAAYRAAILRVGFTRNAGVAPGDELNQMSIGQNLTFASVDPSSTLGKNLAFRAAHGEEFKALAKAGFWSIQ